MSFFELTKIMTPSFQRLNSVEKYCEICLEEIMNYYCLNDKKVLCVHCAKIQFEKDKENGR